MNEATDASRGTALVPVPAAPRATGAGRPAAKARRKKRRVAWTARREALFLATLAETAKIAAGVKASGLSESSIYRRRQTHPGFRARWTEALREGLVKLETMLLDRALNGVERDVWHGGKVVGTMIDYSDRLALALLAAHRGTVREAPSEHVAPSFGEQRTALLGKLSDMNRGMGGPG